MLVRMDSRIQFQRLVTLLFLSTIAAASLAGAAPKSLDLLFVIDNSNSMQTRQQMLVNNFSRFTNVLENLPDGFPNLRVAVVSTDMGAGNNPGVCGGSFDGDNGDMSLATRNCPVSDYFLESSTDPVNGRVQKNFQGSLEDAFACLANLGNQGCGFEQPLEAAKRALDPNGPNSMQALHFIREEALLGIVFITDEDDCSVNESFKSIFFSTNPKSIEQMGPLHSFRCFAHGVECRDGIPGQPGLKRDCRPMEASPYLASISNYIDFFKSLKADPNKIAVAVVLGNPDPVQVTERDFGAELNPSCQSATGSAYPAIRLHHFINRFSFGVETTICQDDFSDALTMIAELLKYTAEQ